MGDIYAGAQLRFKNPVNLKQLIVLVNETEWTPHDVDVKAAAYEHASMLLERIRAERADGNDKPTSKRKARKQQP